MFYRYDPLSLLWQCWHLVVLSPFYTLNTDLIPLVPLSQQIGIFEHKQLEHTGEKGSWKTEWSHENMFASLFVRRMMLAWLCCVKLSLVMQTNEKTRLSGLIWCYCWMTSSAQWGHRGLMMSFCLLGGKLDFWQRPGGERTTNCLMFAVRNNFMFGDF